MREWRDAVPELSHSWSHRYLTRSGFFCWIGVFWFFLVGSQGQYFIYWYCFFVSLCSQIQLLFGYMWWMKEWLPQFQTNKNVIPILGTVMLWYLDKKRILPEGSWYVRFFIHSSDSKSFLFAMTHLFNYGILNDLFSAWFNINRHRGTNFCLY